MLDTIERNIAGNQEAVRMLADTLREVLNTLAVTVPPSNEGDPKTRPSGRLADIAETISDTSIMLDHTQLLARIILEALRFDPTGPENPFTVQEAAAMEKEAYMRKGVTRV